MKKWKKFAATASAIALATVVAAPAGLSQAQAAAKKVNASSTNYKKAAALKTGKNIVHVKKSTAMTKYTAKKTKTYTFKFTGLNAEKKSYRKTNNVNGSVGFSVIQYGGLCSKKVKTRGGSTYSAYLCSKKVWNNTYNKSNITKYSVLPTRTVKVKLKKGQTIYMKNIFTGLANNSHYYKQVYYTVTVK